MFISCSSVMFPAKLSIDGGANGHNVFHTESVSWDRPASQAAFLMPACPLQPLDTQFSAAHPGTAPAWWTVGSGHLILMSQHALTAHDVCVRSRPFWQHRRELLLKCMAHTHPPTLECLPGWRPRAGEAKHQWFCRTGIFHPGHRYASCRSTVLTISHTGSHPLTRMHEAEDDAQWSQSE